MSLRYNSLGQVIKIGGNSSLGHLFCYHTAVILHAILVLSKAHSPFKEATTITLSQMQKGRGSFCGGF
eukprot:c44677_g1_i1 orf=2-202(-)